MFAHTLIHYNNSCVVSLSPSKIVTVVEIGIGDQQTALNSFFVTFAERAKPKLPELIPLFLEREEEGEKLYEWQGSCNLILANANIYIKYNFQIIIFKKN